MKLLDAMKAVELFRSWPPDVQEACFELIGSGDNSEKKCMRKMVVARNKWSRDEKRTLSEIMDKHGPTEEGFRFAVSALPGRNEGACRAAYQRYVKGKTR